MSTTFWIASLVAILFGSGIATGAAAQSTAAAPSTPVEIGIITGSEKGTYYQFGLNLKSLVKPHGINVTVATSKGSVENVFAVYQRPATQLGIVQSDVLAFVARVETDPVLKRIAKKIKMVFPLYNEEIHVLGRKGIADFDGLADKRVAIGREGSGTYLTARLLFKVAEVEPRQMVYIDTDEALAELKAGRIDAMFYVAGAPVKLFAENVTAADNLALIPVTNKNVTEFYPTVEIPANTYRWQAGPLPTIAVKSVLVSFDFRRLDCDNVGRFAQLLASNMGWLTEHGHPKWKSVQLSYPLKGWEQYDCVRKYVGRTAAPVAAASSLNPVLDAIKNMLGE
ncbi:MAG TPA: TAXI family TRAP transporter solute-binding subunit [Vicinamibacterales bacterium]|nr:TAXI family TRAP transporter solute-binding subunit [Vicinamibacterales bacterium]